MASEESTDLSEISKEDHEAVLRGLHGKVFNIVLVGSAGAGKSTLSNTLLGEKCFEEAHSAQAVTEKTAARRIEIDLDGNGKAYIDVHDTPGVTGGRKNDKMVKEELRKIKNFDLLIICFPLDSDGGRYFPGKVNPACDIIETIYGDEVLQEKAIMVLTKANIASDLFVIQAEKDKAAGKTPLSFESQVNVWKEAHQEERAGCVTANLPILTAGRLEMDDKTRKPISITEVANSKDWLNTLWSDICKFTNEELTALLYVRRQKMVADPEVGQEVREAAKSSIWATLGKVALFALGVGAVGVTGGAAIGFVAPIATALSGAAAGGAIGGALGTVAGTVSVANESKPPAEGEEKNE